MANIKTLAKTFDPHLIESEWYAYWEAQGFFAPTGHGDPYTIILPPPNVTGSLHMGHGFGFTLMDILIRYQRMCGRKTLWQPGTDHAGIATQMVVERQSLTEGKSRLQVGREAFIEKIWTWKKESGDRITKQLRRLGASLDWAREKFTLDEDISKTVRAVFIQLYEEGLIYRGTRLVNWDPVLLTAISDLEVQNEEIEGSLWHIRYPLTNDNETLIVATTRPETLLGDVAIAVHPEDKRYQHLLGQTVRLPLCNRDIPIIADEYVDPEFGTGCVKITPAHDFNDYAVGLRHKLTPINIFTPQAYLNENAPKAYQGMERFAAREKILKDLEANNFLEKTEKHLLKIPRGDRSGAIIEPYLTQQWYVNSKALAEPAIKAVEQGKVTFVPDNWSKTYFQWMNNIEDWCISRQLWWGHRIPVWYDEQGQSFVGQDEDDVRQRHQLNKDIPLTQDADVLDTWFSAALWPLVTLGWPNNPKEFAAFFPTSVLVTGFDIIFFWVARMLMMSLKFTQQVPFQNIYITGLIRDAEGHKMSKSKGNVLDPIDLIDGIGIDELVKKRLYGLMQPQMAKKIEKATREEFPEGIPAFGTDALRFTYCSMASFTREIRFDIKRLAGYRNFCNKLWNATRFVLMNTEEKELSHGPAQSLPDRWAVSLLQNTISRAHTQLKQYRFDLLAHTLYEFTWNEFCDWYLELTKTLFAEQNSEDAARTRFILLSTLESLLRLLHPLMPFITEELWQQIAPRLGKQGNSIMLQAYPTVNESLIDTSAEQTINWLKALIVAIRTIRSERNISPGKALPVLLRAGSKLDKQMIAEHQNLIMRLAKLESMQWLASDNPPPSASAFIGELEIFVPLAGFINTEDELSRLNKEINNINKDLQLINNKLNNPQFVDRAPAQVVEKEKLKRADLMQALEKFTEQLKQLGDTT